MYQSDLQGLLKSWSGARISKKVTDIQTFRNQVVAFADTYSQYDLFALSQMLQTIQLCCARGIDKQNSVTQTTSDIDWLMNQLIRSSRLEHDPFLVPSAFNANNNSATELTSIEQRASIAVVDDERSVGMAVCAMLKQFSLEVKYFNSVAEFEEYDKADQFELVLLDVVMPNISVAQVFEFAEGLVQRGVKVISCSSMFNFDTRLQAVRAGVSDYAVKPVNPYQLVEKINRALKIELKRTYQIVLLDDQESMGEFYQAVFSHVNVEFHFFSQAESLFAALEHLQPDLFLLDRIMPNVNGLEVASLIRQESKFDFSPIVFLTADEQLDTKLEILKHGADDLIAKTTPTPLVLEQVMSRLERAAFIKTFVSTDPLTGVLNHGQIVEAINYQMQMAKRNSTYCSFALVDVDFFKNVNDTYGHSAGDMVLNGLGQMLKASIRETDFVGRYGGEEFAILFVDCDIEQAFQKLEELRIKCLEMCFVQDKPDIKVSFSAGLVVLNEFEAVPTAISEADRLLYLAKERGRNQSIYKDPQ